MNIHLENPCQSFVSQLFPFLLSFLDDALLLGFSHLGLHAHWLQWLSPVLLSGTLLYWTVRLLRSQWVQGLLEKGQSLMKQYSSVAPG